MKKAMISQPMGGLTKTELLEIRDKAKAVLEEQGYEVLDTVADAGLSIRQQVLTASRRFTKKHKETPGKPGAFLMFCSLQKLEHFLERFLKRCFGMTGNETMIKHA